MIISADVEKAFDRTHHAFMIFKTLGIEINFLKQLKSIYENPIANIILITKYFPSKIKNKARISALTSFQFCTTGSSDCNKARGKKGI